jgi:Mrp family chromosome partitioning ATPase
MSYVRPGVLIAIIVFVLFAAYAFLAPATYRSSAILMVEPVKPGSGASVTEPLEAARRLSEAILDRGMLEQLSHDRAASTTVEARAQAASEVRQALSVDSSDARAFRIGYKDTDRQRTQRACALLARHALERAPKVLADRSAEFAADFKRQQQTQELAAFLALHPQVAAEPPPSGDKSPDHDPALSAFYAEKRALEKRIFELESGQGTDNPYLDPAQSDPKILRRRLVEIDVAAAARRQALIAPSRDVVPSEVRAEWKRLLELVTRASSDENIGASPQLTARLVAEASLPGWPSDPNRPLLLFFGAVFGVGLGSAFSLSMRASQRRRSISSRPPKAAPQASVTMQLPVAPPIPSNLGPPVPLLPAAPKAAPPIVPSLVRLISSAPPGPPDKDGNAEPQKQPSSNPPQRRFASTLVLPPAENPLALEDQTPDPILASAAQAWDQQIRAHEVPGFAVVKAPSEPPPPAIPPVVTPVPEPPSVSSISTEDSVRRASTRPRSQMKVTQPLGSFLPDMTWTSPPATVAANRSRSVPPARSSSPPPASRYSFVSSAPGPASVAPPASRSSSHPPNHDVVRLQGVPSTWSPDPELTPEAQRGLCEQLYPFAVEACFVLAVVAVPESGNYKSRVAAELALALAQSGHPRVLLMEADFQRPCVQRTLCVDMPMGAGFSQQLRERINRGNRGRWTVIAPQPSLHVLAEGMMRTPGLLLTRQFAEGLKELRSYYDLIIIDGPTSSLEVDSKALDSVIDGLVTVCPAKGSPALAQMQSMFSQKRFSAYVTAL